MEWTGHLSLNKNLILWKKKTLCKQTENKISKAF